MQPNAKINSIIDFKPSFHEINKKSTRNPPPPPPPQMKFKMITASDILTTQSD